MLGPVTGVVADRYDRRRLLMTSLLAMTGIVVTLLGLVIIGHLDVWSLLLATTLWGVLWAIHQPAQQTIQADVLSGRELVNGIALMNTAMNLISILGPALAGALLACCGPRALSAAGRAGMRWSYLVLLGLHLLQLWHYRAIRLVQCPPTVS